VRDREWLTQVYREHSDAVFRYAVRRLRTREDAEDVLVGTFEVAWRRREAVPDQPLPWLYRTAANTIAHVRRTDSRRDRLEARLTAVTPLHAEDAVPDQDLRAALDRLDPDDAEILRLWAWEGLEPREIAAVLDISAGAARTRLHRAKARLRDLYLPTEEVGS
jgi:RNA polymerase sigma-70 factor (ECF subfamily)